MTKFKNIRFSFSMMVIFIYTLVIPMMNFNHHKYNGDEGVIIWDIKSYYAYLPATFIYNDLHLNYLDENPKKFCKWIWPIITPTGEKAILTTMGLSVMYSPFFFIAHGIALSSKEYEADGYSFPYHVSLTFSVYVYFLLALFILRRLLRRYFSELATGITLIAIAAGTNLLYYLTYEAPMSHGYNFFLIILFLYLMIKWIEKSSILNSISLGLVIGLISLIRPTNTLVIILIPLYGMTSFGNLKDNFMLLFKKWPYLLILVICSILVWLPQLFYWHSVSGNFFYFSYGEVDSAFFFGKPQLFNILFSFKKGWYVYTPIMLLATFGMYYLVKQKNPLSWAIAVYFVLNLYILSCWWSWWFGGGFSNRAFIDSYGLMAFPLAAIVDHYRSSRIKFRVLSGLIIALTLLSMFQGQQYTRGTINYSWMNKEAYWEVFLRLHPTCKYDYIINQPDVAKARRGIYEPIPIQDNTISYEDLYSYVDSVISKNITLIDSLDLAGKMKSKSLEKMKEEYISNYIDSGKAKFEYRILRINYLKSKIKDCPSWHAEIVRKAKRKNLSYDEMADLEANRIFEKYSQKYLKRDLEE